MEVVVLSGCHKAVFQCRDSLASSNTLTPPAPFCRLSPRMLPVIVTCDIHGGGGGVGGVAVILYAAIWVPPLFIRELDGHAPCRLSGDWTK